MASPHQSLAEAARKEAERRKSLDQQGVSGKIIDGHDPSRLGPNGNLSVFSPATTTRPPAKSPSDRKQSSPAPFRSALSRLDREIRQVEDRLAILRERAAEARRSPLKSMGSARSRGTGSTEERLRDQIRESELKLQRLRRERSDTYDAGRKAGFLPGELDGKGIIP